MSDSWFDPDAIRGDFESTFTSLYYPDVFSAAKTYVAGERVRLNGKVYFATSGSIGSTPPGPTWSEERIACKLIYENVESQADPVNSMRLAISWRDTKNESISCQEGSLRSIAGTITFWIFTPKNRGTSAGLQVAASVRRELMSWKAIGTCGKEVRVSSVNGPRGSDLGPDKDYFVHILTAGLTTMEQVSYLR